MAYGKEIVTLLLKKYPDPKLALNFSNALELLIATILSAQCTDVRVNEVTKNLFRKYRTAKDYAAADPATLAQEIKPTGYYQNKTDRVINCCKQLVENFNGEVPADVEALTTLPGVGRKTANMVVGNVFAQQAIAVDSHVLRVSNRLGLAQAKSADAMEKALSEQLPREQWTSFSNAIILHGRETCKAKRPRCAECVLYEACEWPDKLSV